MVTEVATQPSRGPWKRLLERAWIYSNLLEGVLVQRDDAKLAARTESLILSITRSLHQQASVKLPQLSLPTLVERLRVLAENPRCTPALAREAVDLAHELVGRRLSPTC